MARKRGVAKATKAELAEWDKILQDSGLSEGRGRRNWLSYLGGSTDMDYLDGAVRTNTGKVKTGDGTED